MSVLESVIPLLTPTGTGWEDLGDHRILGYIARRWWHRKAALLVISAVEVAADKDGVDRGPEYHISVSKTSPAGPSRCSSAEGAWVLAQFGLQGAEEDNHVARGVVRNYWRTVAEPLIGLECACKADEPAIVEDKGDFVWRP